MKERIGSREPRNSQRDLRLPGRDALPTLPSGGPYVNEVTPGFFATTGMRLRDGRDFLEQEGTSRAAIIVNETMAALYWPGRSPVGQCAHVGRENTCTTVVGVVADTRRFRLIEDERYLYYYRPLASAGARALLVRTAPGAGRPDGALRQAVYELDAALPFVRIETLGEALDPQMRPWRLGASVFTAFGILAVILATIGLWSSVAYAVTQRAHEFAIRMALGAGCGTLIRMMLGDGVRRALLATAAGLTIAAAGSRFIADLLYGVSPHEPAVFAAVAVGLPVVAALASALPAWRISRIDPAAVLKGD